VGVNDVATQGHDGAIGQYPIKSHEVSGEIRDLILIG
jgi:hypothetical protein